MSTRIRTSQPKRSEKPKYSDLKDGATHLKDLIGPDNDQTLLNLYKFACTEWQQEEKAFDRVSSGLQDVAEYIEKTVATSWILLIKDKARSREEVKALRAQLAPTDYESYQQARERYLKAKNIGRSKIEIWIQEWERALQEAKHNEIGEVHNEIHATYDFFAMLE